MVANTGEAAAAQSATGISDGNGRYSASQTCESLAAGSERAYRLNINSSTLGVGTHVITISADKAGSIAESSESDNSKVIYLYVINLPNTSTTDDWQFRAKDGNPAAAYLSKSTSSKVATTTFKQGEPIYIQINFWNALQNGTPQEVWAAAFLDAGKWCQWYWSSLKGGNVAYILDSARKPEQLQNLPPGTYTLEILLDSGRFNGSTSWNEASKLNNTKTIEFTIVANTYKVSFSKNGGTGGDNYVTATYGQPMPKRTMPTKPGYVFDGYWTTTGAGGVKYYNSDGTSAHVWDKKGDTTLWAKWVPARYKVTFGKNGGTGGDDYVTATYAAAMPSPRTTPKKAGYVFEGYWSATGQNGTCYYDANMKSAHVWDRASAATLWAKWRKAAVVKVTFGKNGGTGGDSYVTATEGGSMPSPRTAPMRTGWTFGGYWDTLASDANGKPLGKQYYDANMKSVRGWDKTSATTLWAKWTPSRSKVTFWKNGGTGGDNYVTAMYGAAMPTPRTAPKLSGYTFAGYWDTLALDAKGNPKGKQYYDKDMKSVRKWDKTSAATLWAKWTVRVKLGKNGGTGGDDYVTVTYNQPFPKRTMPKLTGYAFGGYWVSSSSKIGKCYNADGTGTSSMKWTTGGTPTIWALWTKTSGAPRTAFLYVASEDGVSTAECTAEEAGGVPPVARLTPPPSPLAKGGRACLEKRPHANQRESRGKG